MKQAADDARLEAKKQNIPTIFLNGGDSFQGTPYYTIYKWQIVAPLIDRLEFDVMVNLRIHTTYRPIFTLYFYSVATQLS